MATVHHRSGKQSGARPDPLVDALLAAIPAQRLDAAVVGDHLIVAGEFALRGDGGEEGVDQRVWARAGLLPGAVVDCGHN